MYTQHSLNIEQVRLSLEDGFVCLQVFFGHLSLWSNVSKVTILKGHKDHFLESLCEIKIEKW